MTLGYRVAYRLGLTPWEKAGEAFGPQLDALLDKVEGTRALDVGCGTGEHAVRLSQRGWDTLGIDTVPLALTKARTRARTAGVDTRFAQADVTALGDVVGEPVQLVLDVGCFHGLPDEARVGYGRELTRIADQGAVLLMFAFGPGKRGPLPRGASRSDVQAALPGWDLSSQEAADTSGMPGPLKSAAPQWYRFTR